VRPCRLHVTGASGAGTTTLARTIANEWSVPHADVDDYFWVPSSPPYSVKRPVQSRLDLMNEIFLPRDAWVLSGSIVSWGEPLLKRFDAVVFLVLDPAARLARLRAREVARHGAAIEAGGTNQAAHAAFMEWASGYDDPGFSGRSRVQHERWLGRLTCPVLRLDSAEPVSRLLARVDSWMAERDHAGPDDPCQD
jgi:adenylate kinase family enzyme